MAEHKYVLMEFSDLADNLKRLFRISTLKQNKIIEQFMDRVGCLDDGFMINDAVVDALHELIPQQLRFNAKQGLDTREKAVCRKFFADQMEMLSYRVEHDWDSCGPYPYDDYQSMISASESMLGAIESIAFNLTTHNPFVSTQTVAAASESVIQNKINTLTKDICTISGYEPEYVRRVLLMQKNMFFYTLKSAWKQTCLLHGWVVVEPANEDSFADVVSGEESTATRRASVSRPHSRQRSGHVHPVEKHESPENSGQFQGATEPNVLSLHLCAVEDIKKILSNNKKLKPVDMKSFEKLRNQQGYASLAAIPASYRDIIKRFRARFPHMSPLADAIEANLSLQSMGGVAMPLNLLAQICILNGAPGVGKTVAVSFLAKEFQVAFRVIDCAGLSNGFDITGHSSGWSSGKSGHVAEMLIERQSPNGIIILDEVDKMNGNDTSPVSNALYSLLESKSAKHFRDEFYDVEMDASRINWLATSNDYERIPAPIRDRAKRITIPMPDMDQRKTIASYLYHDERVENERIWGKYFAPELPDDVAAFMATESDISIRGMKQVIHDCFASLSILADCSSALPLESITISEAVAATSLHRYLKENGHNAVQEDVCNIVPADVYKRTKVGFIYDGFQQEE